MEIKKILVPVDGSKPSGRAFDCACAMAKGMGAKLVLLNIVIIPGFRVEVKPEDIEYVTKKGRAIVDDFAGKAPEGLEIEKKVEIGLPTNDLVRIAEEEKVDLIVMGNSGKGALSSFVIGSVSHYALQHVNCPVVIVK
jgi:nucleotide-binding universal stress UspA family protein